MQLLLASDLHYDLRQLDWVLGQAADFEVVVLAGDLLDLASAVPLEAQVPVIVGYLTRLAARTTTLVCSGNHDLTARDDHGEKVASWLAPTADVGVITDFGSTFVGDTLFTVSPFWDGPLGRAEVETFLAAQAALVRGPWIWVYHWPPPDLPVSWIGSRSYGDADLAGWIDRFHPTLVLTGHVHQAPLVDGGSWIARTPGGTAPSDRADPTWVINAGHQPGPVPSHVIVDLAAGTASWWSNEGSAEQSLLAVVDQ